ncbi:DUF3857 domain-containing protein [Draconibacterium sp. IB214405]|uniref:DUF3857 domain-containing protein n=1 Tax=Draconibacterium sp. IB214405 TaxID=3097352 RepID=UPI002A16DE72|nr:DUF3857 domain-containing protein [Draconibacterium sp. IB214405]MDX8340577.1 DUF3857 domain-containing protein [Draconibacterium sp. IB214405]
MRRSLFLFCFILSLQFQNTLFAQRFDAVLINQKTVVEIKKNNLSKINSLEILIINRKGEEFAEVTIPFSSLVKVSNIKAYIKDNNGKIVKKLKNSDISERSSISGGTFYQDDFVKEFRLKHNVYPYTLVYEYEEAEDEFLFVEHWVPLLDLDIPTLNAELEIVAPKDFKLSYKNNFVSSFNIDSTDNEYQYHWKTSYDGSIQQEVFAPPLLNHVPSVQVVPQNFDFEIKGSFDSWESYGKWQDELISGLFELPENEIKTIENRINGLEDKKAVIKTIYQYVQDETRYINISLETGGLKPYPASYVSKNHYGDCKALSIYFMALLKSVGIECYYAKLSAGDPIEAIDHSLPSMQSNHIIVCVPVQNDTLWLDCTSDNPFEYIGTFIQNREAFVINGEKSHFAKIPALTKDQVLCERHITVENVLQNECLAEFSNTYRGNAFESLHNLITSTNENDNLEIVREHLIPNGFEPVEIKNHQSIIDSVKVQLTYTAKSNRVYEKYGNDLIIRLLAFGINNFESVADRVLPVQIDYPVYQKDSINYKISADYTIQNLPENKEIKSKYGVYSINVTTKDNTVEISKSFLIHSGNYPLTEYEEFYAFISQIVAFEKKFYINTTKKTS